MDKHEAISLASIVTMDDIKYMLISAQSNITDWHKPSVINVQCSIGYTWNILTKGFDVNTKIPELHITNLIWEFGEYLDASKFKKIDPKELVHLHSDPVFLEL